MKRPDSEFGLLAFGFWLLAFALCLLSACNTLPVGSGELERAPQADSTTLLPDTAAGYSKYVGLGPADVMYLGRDAQYQSRVVLRFPLPDTALDSAVSAQLVLHRADSSSMSLVVRPCSSAWNVIAVSWRMADSVTHWLNPGGDYWKVDLGTGTFSEESLVIELNLGRLDTLIRPAFCGHGILIFPADTGFVAVHSGYTSATAPRLRINYPDNTSSVYSSVDDAHLVDTLDLGRGASMKVGSGVAFRTYLQFNVESIPAAATIVKAELAFRPAVEYRRKDTLRIGARRLLEPFERAGRNAKFEDSPRAVTNYIALPDSDPEAVLDLRQLVQFWTAHPDSNLGLLLVAQPEWSMMFRLGIPRVGPDAPNLRLLYVMPPEDRLFR